MQNARRKPYKMRTVAEWREIYLRVRDWDGGEGNPVHRQCPVCLGRFTPKKADARFCSQSCRNLWSRARAIAGETSREAPNLAPSGVQPRREAAQPRGARRLVELAVCEDCHRVFHPASMRGALCVSCASRRAVPDPSKPPAGFVQAVCKDCGRTFAKPRSASTFYCWKCADRRLAERPAVFEDAVCEDCGKTFRRPVDAHGRPQAYCRECARKRLLLRYRRYKAKRKANAECRMQNEPGTRNTEL